MNKIEIDDKIAVIIAVTVLAGWGAWLLRADTNSVMLVLSNAMSGLFGIAVGKTLTNGIK